MIDSTLTWDTELDWLQERDDALNNGSGMLDGKRHVLYLDSDESLEGYDVFYDGIDKIIMHKWQRTPIASYVVAQVKTLGLERAISALQHFDNWLQEYRAHDEREREDVERERVPVIAQI